MTVPWKPEHIEFGGPATYRIVVQGILGEEWGERLAGMAIASSSQEGSPTQTTLVGMIRDQAELSGVLSTLFGLHLSILKVEEVSRQSGETRQPGPGEPWGTTPRQQIS